jgi:hypothetical protein
MNYDGYRKDVLESIVHYILGPFEWYFHIKVMPYNERKK